MQAEKRSRCRSTGRTRRGGGAGGWRRSRSRACTSIQVSMRSSVNTPPAVRKSLSASRAIERLVERRRAPGAPWPAPRAAGRRGPCRPGRAARSVVHAVEAGHQHGRERQVRVGRRVGAAELDPLGLRALRGQRDAARRRAVALAVDEVDRRLVAGHQPLVAVGGRARRRRGSPGRGAAGRRCTSGRCRTGRRSRSRRRTAARRPSTATGGRACPSRCPGRSAWA